MELLHRSEKNIYVSTVFSVSSINTSKRNLHLLMRLKGPVVNTSELPNTISILTSYCPNVLTTDCFNDKNLPFIEEVKRTEIGHLFEHLLLVNVCVEKVKRGIEMYCLEGKTSWNWKTEPWGTFHIFIPHFNDNDAAFKPAFSDAISLTERVLHN